MCEHVTKDTKREKREGGAVTEHQEKEEEEEEAYSYRLGKCRGIDARQSLRLHGGSIHVVLRHFDKT